MINDKWKHKLPFMIRLINHREESDQSENVIVKEEKIVTAKERNGRQSKRGKEEGWKLGLQVATNNYFKNRLICRLFFLINR